MGVIEEKYNIYYINDKRIYVDDLSKNLLLENTIPYMFEYKDIRIYDTAWNRITMKILETIDNLNPKGKEELLKLTYKWSNAPVFSDHQYSNFQQFKDIYFNTNHTATHAWMNIQLLLSTYGIPLEECKMHIRRHPQAEPKEAKEYYKGITINGYKKVLRLAGLSQQGIETTLKNLDVISKKFLSEISKGFTDFYLFDDYAYFVNYKQKVTEYIYNKFYGTPYVQAAERGLGFLDIYYRNKHVFDNFERVNYLLNRKNIIDNEIAYLFDQTPIKAISVRKLISRLKIVNPEFMSVLAPYDSTDSFYALVNALFYQKYTFKRPFIAANKDIALSYDDLTMSYIYTLDSFTIPSINKYLDKMHLKRPDNYLKLFEEISEDFVQVSLDKLIAKENFFISETDITKIKDELRFFISSFGAINTKVYNGYTQMPKIEYPWNKYLLVGIVRTYLKNDFEIEYTTNSYDLTDFIIKQK